MVDALAWLAAYAVLMCGVFLLQIGSPRRHPDRGIAWFLAVNTACDLTTWLTVWLVLVRLLHGHVAVGVLICSAAAAGAFYTWRVWLGRRIGRRKVEPMGTFLHELAPYAKAIRGAIIAGLGATIVALASPGITATEWILIALAVLGTGEQVWSTPNAPEPKTTQPPITVDEGLQGTTYASGRAGVE